MPHVVLKGSVHVKEIFTIINPIFVRLENGLIKSSEFFISQNENSMIIKALSIENEKKISFLILISNRDDGIVIRLYPDFDIPKTFGVKKMLAEIAILILKEFKGLSVGKTNLSEFLPKKNF
ncbi:MAG: hypothetical protein ACFFAM_08520 [Promethearchaeota archaeon]